MVDTNKYTQAYIERRNAKIREAQAKYRPEVRNFSYDIGLPTRPVGHRQGFKTSAFITSDYRKTHRKASMDVTAQQVIDVLVAGGVQQWVLMGLYGYVGYMPQPRATQDVDVLIANEEAGLATQALLHAWPTLTAERYEVVIRFFDPGEVSMEGKIQHVIDLMLPSNDCHEAILTRYHMVDEETGHRIPILEAAIASKYAALVSPNRAMSKKEFDAGDLRGLLVANHDNLDRQLLGELGDLVFDGGGAELHEFLRLAIEQKPFPI